MSWVGCTLGTFRNNGMYNRIDDVIIFHFLRHRNLRMRISHRV